MSKEASDSPDRGFTGSLPLYVQPELLTSDDHGQLGIDTTRQSFRFASGIRTVPLAAVELSSAQRSYPIVFSGIDQPLLLAVLGFSENENLFVDEAGNWDPAAYIPAYVRCHPFAVAKSADDQALVVIDRAADVVSDKPDQPFFVDGNLSPAIQERVDFCARFDAHRRASKPMCERLRELGLLAAQSATVRTGEGDETQQVASYVGVDFDRLNQLDADTLKQLHADGTLLAIYTHRLSLDNWAALVERRLRRGGGEPG